MKQGIVKLNDFEDQIAEFVINELYPMAVLPIVCIQTGPRVYGYGRRDEPYNYLGIHFMDTWDYLDHPDNKEVYEVFEESKSKQINKQKVTIKLRSYEINNFLNLIKAGYLEAYEVLYMPVIHQEPGASLLINKLRNLLNARIGSPLELELFTFDKNQIWVEEIISLYHQNLQAIQFLREGIYEWNINDLKEFWGNNKTPSLDKYINRYKIRNTNLEFYRPQNYEQFQQEIQEINNELIKVKKETKIQKETPLNKLQIIYEIIKRERASMI